jgi:hypothetical protein
MSGLSSVETVLAGPGIERVIFTLEDGAVLTAAVGEGEISDLIWHPGYVETVEPSERPALDHRLRDLEANHYLDWVEPVLNRRLRDALAALGRTWAEETVRVGAAHTRRLFPGQQEFQQFWIGRGGRKAIRRALVKSFYLPDEPEIRAWAESFAAAAGWDSLPDGWKPEGEAAHTVWPSQDVPA